MFLLFILWAMPCNDLHKMAKQIIKIIYSISHLAYRYKPVAVGGMLYCASYVMANNK